MKIGVALVLVCLLQGPAYACDIESNACLDVTTPLAGQHPVTALSFRDMLRPAHARGLLLAEVQTPDKRALSTGSLGYESAFARAIARAAKRSAAELALEAATKIIVMCQKERNPALTTPFFRSDSQQAHCFRY